MADALRPPDDSPNPFVGYGSPRLLAEQEIEQDLHRVYKEVLPAAIAEARQHVSEQEAEDVVNDVLLELHGQWKKVPAALRRANYFLRRVRWRAKNLRVRDARLNSLPRERDDAVDSHEGEYRYPTTLPAPMRVSEPGSDSALDIVEFVQRVIGRMPAQRQLAFRLRLDGFSYDEIARHMGITVGAVNKYITIGRKEIVEDALREGVRIAPPTERKALRAATTSVVREERYND